MNYEFLILSFILFCLSMIIFFSSKNLIIVLISIELMLNSLNIAIANLSFFKYSAIPYVWIILIFGITAAEAAIGLSIIILMAKKMKTIDTDFFSYIRERHK
ncbi:MAG: NADH-quinone oxidoreductase subunit NuoK [Elusimicrobiales bacterium]|nr:NADH-quinone oxidoreductase subunit NuoK [Elusimicrobiales bacterium]